MKAHSIVTTLFATATAVAVASVAFAQTTRHHVASKPTPFAAPLAPTMVFGVPLGETFTLPKCAEVNPITVSETCWTYEFDSDTPTDARMSRTLHFPTSPTLGADITAHVDDTGKVDFFTMETAGISDQDYVMGQLIAKFGKPTEFKRVPVQNRMGASYIVDRAVWDIPTCFVQFDADGSDGGAHEGKIDEGWISISTREYQKKSNESRKKFLESRQPL